MWLFGPQITELCLEFICYDPNYNYGSDDEDEFMETDMEDDDEEWVMRNPGLVYNNFSIGYRSETCCPWNTNVCMKVLLTHHLLKTKTVVRDCISFIPNDVHSSGFLS